MNTELDDDLDTTAELPQLDLQSQQFATLAHSASARDAVPVPSSGAFSADGQTGQWPVPDTTDSGFNADSSWQLVDELLTVRDKIVDLEASLLDAELKLAKLGKEHQELQASYNTLSIHDTEVSKDRDRLAEERSLLAASQQQIKDQFESLQAQAETNLLRLQQQLEQMRQQASAERTQQTARHEQLSADATHYQQRIEQLLVMVSAEQARATALGVNLHAAVQARSAQEAAAAAMARNLSHELLEKEALQTGLTQREQRIRALELVQQQVTEQLGAAEARHEAALATVAQLQTALQNHEQRITGLQVSLAEAEERSLKLSEQLDAKHGDWRSAEQDKERLRRLATAEHESYESTRQELAARLAELTALQEQLQQARTTVTELNAGIAERDRVLQARDQELAKQQQALQQATEHQAATDRRTTALTESLTVLQDELQQKQVLLGERDHGLVSAAQQLADERQARLRLQTLLDAGDTQMRQLAMHQQERDNFILEQASELEQLQHTVGELSDQLDQAETLNRKQLTQIRLLETELTALRAEREQQGMLLAQARQELAAKGLEQGASALQVEALQSQLRQHVDALNAIRRDIHHVAQQSRHRESDLQVRTLVRVDDENVVQLLNKPVMVIGRAPDSEICLQLPSISRRHACLRVGRDVVILEDLGSTNGCYVNGKRVKRQLLKDGDKLEIGDVMFRFATRATQG